MVLYKYLLREFEIALIHEKVRSWCEKYTRCCLESEKDEKEKVEEEKSEIYSEYDLLLNAIHKSMNTRSLDKYQGSLILEFANDIVQSLAKSVEKALPASYSGTCDASSFKSFMDALEALKSTEAEGLEQLVVEGLEPAKAKERKPLSPSGILNNPLKDLSKKENVLRNAFQDSRKKAMASAVVFLKSKLVV